MIYNLKEFEGFIPERQTFAVMGNPIKHSLSPALHMEFKKETGIDFDYIALEVSPDDFTYALKLAKEKLCGFNLTMPLKQLVLPYLDYIDSEVERTGSANTISVIDGKLHGYTTDGVGFCDALLMSLQSLDDTRALILGAGGAARSVASALSKQVAHITVAVRNSEKGKSFVSDLSDETSACTFDFTTFDSISDTYDILINATPVGMEAGVPAPVDLSSFSNLKFVYDCIYNPPVTTLLCDAKRLNIPYDNGLSMLILQGAYAQRHWFNASFSKDVIKKILLTLRAKHAMTRLSNVHNKQNIVLTGFMGSGKTTIGKKLAESLGMNFVDLDAKIEAEQRMKITQIFDKYGEEHFRALETRACNDCLKLCNTVISTGGGTVIRFENDKILKKNSVIVFLNRTINEIVRNLEGSTNRPLLNVNNVQEHIRSLYELRQPQYLERSDISVTFRDGIDPVEEILLSI